jgi:hypothetical protein
MAVATHPCHVNRELGGLNYKDFPEPHLWLSLRGRAEAEDGPRGPLRSLRDLNVLALN